MSIINIYSTYLCYENLLKVLTCLSITVHHFFSCLNLNEFGRQCGSLKFVSKYLWKIVSIVILRLVQILIDFCFVCPIWPVKKMSLQLLLRVWSLSFQSSFFSTAFIFFFFCCTFVLFNESCSCLMPFVMISCINWCGAFEQNVYYRNKTLWLLRVIITLSFTFV